VSGGEEGPNGPRNGLAGPEPGRQKSDDTRFQRPKAALEKPQQKFKGKFQQPATRARGVQQLNREDIDFERKVLVLRVVKGDGPYAVPMPDRLAAFLREYREKDWVPNQAGWVFACPRAPERPLHQQVKNI
jgi:hypothetical protein